MNTHEIIGLMAAGLGLAAFVSVVTNPNGAFANVLSAGIGSFAGLTGVVAGRSATFPGGVTVGG